MRSLFHTILILKLVMSFFALSGRAGDDSREDAPAQDYILCSRDAEIVPVLPSLVSTSDTCSGTVALQGISYQCGPEDQVDRKRKEFLAKIKLNGRAYCENYCRKRSTKNVRCEGVFTEPSKCGFTIPTREALKFGQSKGKCDPGCGGQAFAYCSIYHASMLQVEPSLFANVRPNCECRAFSTK